MTTPEILAELKSMASESTRRVMVNHGAPSNYWGVKIEDMKTIVKKVKKNHALSLELYDSGVSDAQYLAGLIADEKMIAKKDLQHWAKTAAWHMQSEYTVAWIAAESRFGWELALEWIDSPVESIQSSGWNTLSSLLSIKPDADINKDLVRKLMKRVEKEMAEAPDRVQYTMNNFLIATGGYVPELTEEALRIGNRLGKLTINMGNTDCKVPYAPDYINKMKSRGVKKKKMARC